MTLKKKFRLTIAVVTAGLLTVAAFWIREQRITLINDKQQSTRDLVAVPYSVIEQEYKLQSEGKISRAEAQRRAIQEIRTMRYSGNGYFWINDEHPTMVMHPMKPELDGTDLTSLHDPTGKAVFVVFRDAAQGKIEGDYVYYLWPKPGMDQPVEKLSFVKRFAPWGWVIGTGVYINDINAAWRGEAWKAGIVVLICLAPALFLLLSTSQATLRRLGRIFDQMKDIAEGEGDLTRRIVVTSHDEVGELARCFNTFMERLQGMVSSIADTAQQVAHASAELSSSSQQISTNSEDTASRVSLALQAAQRVNENLESVSTGAGEMTSTIQSIAGNAHEAATTASNAVQTAQTANATVAKLGESSAEIGEVIKVITSIAQQTNLLALNATIEAARAGEAGKGFAVVANEVKELAKQTAKATEDIGRKITAIQTDTKGAVEAIGSISGVIAHVNDISGTIATAVEEQSATTNEMTRNVGDAAKGSGDIRQNIEGVAEAVRGTSDSAQASQKSARELAETAERLRGLVAQFHIAEDSHGAEVQKAMGAAAGQ